MPMPSVPRKADDVEILVHIAAPARAVDDKHYRALATAYLNFEADSNAHSKAQQPQDQPERLPSSPTEHGLRRSSLSSIELSFSGAWGNPDSPRLQVAPAHEPFGNQTPHASPRDAPYDERDAESGHRQSTQQESLVPPSEVPDSMPLNNFGMPGLISPSRLIEHFMRGPSSSQPAPLLCPSLGKVIPGTPILQDPFVDIIPATSSGIFPGPEPDDDASHVVPSTPLPARREEAPPTPSIGSEVDVIEDTILDGTPIVGKKRAAPESPTRAASEPPHNKRNKPTAKEATPGPLTRSTSDTGANDNHTTSYPLVLRNTDTNYLALLEIDAPAPPVGTCDVLPGSLVTPNLTALAQSLDLSRRFRPVESKRDLRPFERGYWLLECGEWDDSIVQRTWGFLHNYVSQGLAGWGSRCVRDEDWKWIRLWCFGHVVGHTYLLLYLASERKLKTEGARWIDADGKTILVTNGHA